MMHNNLFINRLYILTENGKVAYDETFHKGVNIIRGDNSSGKSTITHFIFFALGGAFNDFVPEARACSTVYIEVEINTLIFTIKRGIEKDDNQNISTQSPLYFFWGIMEESFSPPSDKNWEKYGYKTLPTRKSFSNILFNTLNLPIVKGDNNITFHQILRLLYIDQDSPTSSLFYYENFDSQLTRETVSDLLMGVYDEKLYENKKRLIIAERELNSLKSEIKATRNFFSDDFSLNSQHIKVSIENKEEELSNVNLEINHIRNKEKEIKYNSESKLYFQRLNEMAISHRKEVANIEQKISLLNSEIEDSTYFIESLITKQQALKNSINTREFLGNLPLEYCPDCLSLIKENTNNSKCKLCKEQIDKSFGVMQAKRMELEIGFQIEESSQLLELDKRKLIEIESKYSAELGKLNDIQIQVNASLVDVKSYNEEAIDDLNVKKGFIEGEILQLRTLLENAELYARLLKLKSELEGEIKSLKRYITSTEKRQKSLKVDINNQLTKEGIYLLNKDLDRQDEFKNANEFFIDFSNNIAFLSNKFSKYSASSNFYLKVTARFSLFLASLANNEMRYPRFIFADNMEDKGIEMSRAQNLQRLLIERLRGYDSNTYQMIYTTSYITDELNKSEYVVGEYYTKDNHSLKNVR